MKSANCSMEKTLLFPVWFCPGRFGEEEGFACADSSGNGNDGSLVGYPAGEVSNWVEGEIGGALSPASSLKSIWRLRACQM